MKKRTLYIATIMSKNKLDSSRDAGDWSCWVGYTKEYVLDTAMKYRDIWSQKYPHCNYQVHLGTLTNTVLPPPVRIGKLTL